MFYFVFKLGTAALKVNATDRDEGPNAEIQYLIVSGSVGDAFTLDATTGALTTKKSLDRESTDFYNLVIAAQDKGVPPLRSTVNLQVRVLDQNDNRPSFSQAAYTTQILENSGPDFDVIDIDASDPDQGTNGDVSVSVLSENGASPQNFKIVKRRGDVSRLFVQTSKNLDREQRSFYHLRLQASDGAQPPKKAVTDVNITVVDENDNSPTIISPTKLNPVTEGINPGPEIATFRGEDKDAGINAQVTFTIVSGNEGSEFILNSDTGVLKLAKKLDREVKGQYNIKVKIQDKGTPSYRSFTDYILNVTDVNDNAPKFLKDKYTGRLFVIRSNLSTLSNWFRFMKMHFQRYLKHLFLEKNKIHW